MQRIYVPNWHDLLFLESDSWGWKLWKFHDCVQRNPGRRFSRSQPSCLKISSGRLLELGTVLLLIVWLRGLKVWVKAKYHSSANFKFYRISLSTMQGLLKWIPWELLGEFLCPPQEWTGKASKEMWKHSLVRLWVLRVGTNRYAPRCLLHLMPGGGLPEKYFFWNT